LPVIGVIGDYRELGPEQKPPAQVFLPYTLEVWAWMQFIVRSPQPAAILSALTTAVKGVDPAATFLVKPSARQADAGPSFADPRVFVATLMSGFAFMALLVAAIGLYGIVAYGVAQRTREIGIRIAVGATPRVIMSLVLRYAVALVAGGVAVGLLVAIAATRLVQSMLFETTTTDLATFLIVPLVLAAVAIAASLIPAYRATRTDPIIAIRAD
jgi:putative ABC transport system permease protein